KFEGASQAYFENRTERFDLISGAKSTEYSGRMGDVPALVSQNLSEGLLLSVHQTRPSSLKYNAWEKFQAFADHKDFPDIRRRHEARGLPDSGFRESYTRFAKSLIAVDSGQGQDRQTGLEIEFVALANPYTAPLNGIMPVQLFYQNAPRRDAQVEVFERRPSGDVRITLFRTDDRGMVDIPVTSGHTYLLDSVLLRPMTPDQGAVWETLWAALTFHVP
ncbi:MAG: DUF4198 domain-containing protein, partial [Pseudomonadota bacterium]